MSLDFYLESPEKKKEFCPTCCNEYETSEEVYWRNITHNLNSMAGACFLYEPLWRPIENNWLIASDITSLLFSGLTLLKSDPERFKLLNPENGWGKYETLIDFTETTLEACKKFPNAKIRISK